ncbi:hypothetical protein CL616_04565 [archaeon]|nr:hypothetical protein [archaeon]|tara:strand:- start:631 stop:1038 length:408 start_codon:yes stop_codon:yes gene_type:complete
MKNPITKGLIIGTILLVVGFGLNFLINAIFPFLAAEYQNTAIFRAWTDPLMWLFFLYPFIIGIAFSLLWEKTNFKEKNIWKNGLNFGLFYFVIATIPGMVISYSSFQVSLLMTLSWTFSGLLYAVLAGILLTKWK